MTKKSTTLISIKHQVQRILAHYNYRLGRDCIVVVQLPMQSMPITTKVVSCSRRGELDITSSDKVCQ